MHTDYHDQLAQINAELAELDAAFVALNAPEESPAPGGVIKNALRLLEQGGRLLKEQSETSAIVNSLEQVHNGYAQQVIARHKAQEARALLTRVSNLRDRLQTYVYELERDASKEPHDAIADLRRRNVPDTVIKAVQNAGHNG